MKQSRHAQKRSQQRAIPQRTIEAVLCWGRELHQDQGRTAYFIGHLEVKSARRRGIDLAEHINVGVVIASDETIVTVIRTKDVRRLKRFILSLK